jgi:hypothetical protein
MHATCPANFIVINFVILIIFDEDPKLLTSFVSSSSSNALFANYPLYVKL